MTRKKISMEDELKKLIKNEINHLDNIKENIKINKLSRITIAADSLKNYKVNMDLPSIQKAIYIITSDVQIKINEVEQKFNNIKKEDEFKEKKYKRGMCRINKDNKKNYKCLYVGSSQNYRIKSRLMQHLGFGPISTFSLHFNEWWEQGEIFIDIYEIQNGKKELQLFEDLLWEKYKPLFGRQGKK